mmetsp:Transcript_10669/g.28505  ORF Transcript_10669/g.28505 Transcript_10669/m.28505 type:complete len:95 (-) Transcript_10669:83-367(-)
MLGAMLSTMFVRGNVSMSFATASALANLCYLRVRPSMRSTSHMRRDGQRFSVSFLAVSFSRLRYGVLPSERAELCLMLCVCAHQAAVPRSSLKR